MTRKINDFSPEQEQNLVAIVWLYRGQTERYRELLADYRRNGENEAADWLEERFPDGKTGIGVRHSGLPPTSDHVRLAPSAWSKAGFAAEEI